MTLVARRPYSKCMHVTVASPFLHTIELGASRQDHAMEISHEALRVFDSRRDCCDPPERKPLRKKLRLRNRTRLREPTHPCRCRETKQFKNVMPKQRSGATAIFSQRKRPCTATA